MQIFEEKQEDVTILTIDHHLDTASAPAFEARLIGLIDRGVRKLLINCGPLEYVNSAGLKALLIAAKKLDPLGGKLVLCALAPAVQMIFEMIGFNRIMTIMPTREEALRVLRGETAPA